MFSWPFSKKEYNHSYNHNIGYNDLTQPWSNNIEDIFTALGTSISGLDSNSVARRQAEHGKNVFENHEKRSAFSIIIKQFASPLIFILIVAAVITFLLKEWIEVIVIALAVLTNAGLGFYREFHAENTLEKLSTFIKNRTRVIRDGREFEIDSDLIVPGDIIKLSYGNRVPADARLININSLRVNEAILTGESQPVEKKLDLVAVSATVPERANMIHAGTLVVDGFATAVIVSIGNKTEIGKIAGLVSDTGRAVTPIQRGLGRLAWIIFGIVLITVVALFILGLYRGQDVLDMLILSAAISVGAVPEALPIVLTVILSVGAERIARKRGVTRTLVAAETLGSTSLIMTDKTGTLTEANLKLVGSYRHGIFDNEKGSQTGEAATEKTIALNADHSAESKADQKTDHPDNHNHLLQIALSNVDVLIENPEEQKEKWTFKGKPFEVNIVETAREHGLDLSPLKGDKAASIVIPFSSSHKFSVSRFEGSDKSFVIMGAPDILLAKSDVTKEQFIEIESWILKASNEGKRLVAVGRLDLSRKKTKFTLDDVKKIKFEGILAFIDPIRKNVPDAIRRIESLGTKIVMITGDLKGTAIAVARDLGWEVGEDQVLTGHDIQALTDEELLKVIPHKRIFARVTPEDKLRIGQLYRQLGEVVAMTGDGVNDAPALKAMDIGVAIGSGSDVAKSVADLVLLDDNFEIISMAIQEGRRILVNIRKAFVYLMSNSLDGVFVVGGSFLVGIALPLTALQIIWVNLFTGSLPALAFAYDDDFDHESSKRHTLKSIFTAEVNILTSAFCIRESGKALWKK